MILAWPGDELSRGQARSWHTDRHTHRQTQAMTIPVRPKGLGWKLYADSMKYTACGVNHYIAAYVNNVFELHAYSMGYSVCWMYHSIAPYVNNVFEMYAYSMEYTVCWMYHSIAPYVNNVFEMYAYSMEYSVCWMYHHITPSVNNVLWSTHEWQILEPAGWQYRYVNIVFTDLHKVHVDGGAKDCTIYESGTWNIVCPIEQ